MQILNVLKALEQMMIRRTPSPDHSLAKQVAITSNGLTVLRAALPLVIDVQEKLFGDEARPGGKLLEALVRMDQGQGDAAY